jgi:flavin reductase (DIM6/NTAB) family NADH-FMN oxidoreductase RutF
VCTAPYEEARAAAAAKALRSVMQAVPAAVAIVSVPAAGVALSVSSCVSCSLSPPLVSFNVQRGSGASAALCSDEGAAVGLSVDFLGADGSAVAACFARSGAVIADGDQGWWEECRNGGCEWRALRRSVASLWCERRSVYAAGDHDILVAEVIATRAGDIDAARALLWARRAYHTSPA